MNEKKEDNDETDVKGEYRRYITPDYKSTSIQGNVECFTYAW